MAKAALLQKGAEYIRQLSTERNQLREEMDSLRQQIESLNTSIRYLRATSSLDRFCQLLLFCSNCQSMLPATGAPVSRRRDSRMQEMFDEYVINRTMDNWKFWIVSFMFNSDLFVKWNFVSLLTDSLLWFQFYLDSEQKYTDYLIGLFLNKIRITSWLKKSRKISQKKKILREFS